MKKILLVLALLGAAAGAARAADFALIDPQHPKIVTGAFTDLKGHNDGGVTIALVRSLAAPGWVPVDGGGLSGPRPGWSVPVSGHVLQRHARAEGLYVCRPERFVPGPG